MENSTGKIVGVGAVAIAVLALLVGLVFHHPASNNTGNPAPVQNVGGERGGVQEFFSGIRNGDSLVRTFARKMEPGTDQVVIYHNTSGKDVLVTRGSATIITGETASSTFNITIFATTTNSIAAGQGFGTLSEGSRNLIGPTLIATTTTATTTSSTKGIGSGVVLVPSGSYVFGYLQRNLTQCGVAVAGFCENATSTARGFNPIFNISVESTDPRQSSL